MKKTMLMVVVLAMCLMSCKNGNDNSIKSIGKIEVENGNYQEVMVDYNFGFENPGILSDKNLFNSIVRFSKNAVLNKIQNKTTFVPVKIEMSIHMVLDTLGVELHYIKTNFYFKSKNGFGVEGADNSVSRYFLMRGRANELVFANTDNKQIKFDGLDEQRSTDFSNDSVKTFRINDNEYEFLNKKDLEKIILVSINEKYEKSKQGKTKCIKSVTNMELPVATFKYGLL
jgi:hypothetical protein